MPLLPPIELIPDSDLSRRVTKKRRLASPDRSSLEKPLRQHCTECNYMLPNLPFRSVTHSHTQHRHHQNSLNGQTTPSMCIRPTNLCDTASIQDPVTPPRRPVPLEEELDYNDEDEGSRVYRRKRLAQMQLPWLYRKPKFLSATVTHSGTSSSPCSSTDSLPLVTPGSSYHSHSIPASIASSPRSIFGASPPLPDTPMHWAQQDSTPIWTDAWDDDIVIVDSPSDLIPWEYPSSTTTITTTVDPVPLDSPTSRTPRARARQNRHSTRSYQPYWSRANIHARPTTTRSAALETAQSTLPSWMRSSTSNRPSWRHSLIGSCPPPDEPDKDLSPPRPATPPMKFSTSSFHLSSLKLR